MLHILNEKFEKLKKKSWKNLFAVLHFGLLSSRLRESSYFLLNVVAYSDHEIVINTTINVNIRAMI